jgi:hypothetical protein
MGKVCGRVTHFSGNLVDDDDDDGGGGGGILSCLL